MPKLTYRAQTSDDPVFTTVGNHRFEHGKAVEVDDDTFAKLSKNPWFRSGKAATEEAAGLAGAGSLVPGPSSGIDSSVMPAYPPGSGMKFGEDLVKTEAGMVPADDADTDEVIGEYEIKHKGRGRYDVLKGGETAESGLTKGEAESYVRARSV